MPLATATAFVFLFIVVLASSIRAHDRRIGMAVTGSSSAEDAWIAAASQSVASQVVPPQAGQAWGAIKPYLEHENLVALSNLWLLYKQLVRLHTLSGQKKAAAAFVVTGEYFTTLRALQEVDEKFTEALDVRTDGRRNWTCAQYGRKERPALALKERSFFPSRTFETANTPECVSAVKDQLGRIRESICSIESSAMKWAEEMANEDLHPFFVDMEEGKMCLGEPLTSERLAAAGILDPRPGRSCIARQNRTACARACFATPECAAVAYKSKRQACCFLQGRVTVIRNASRSEHCFEQVGPRETFLMLRPEGVAKWLSERGFGHYEDKARSFGGFGLTGMVLSFLPEPMLEAWLGTASTNETATLRCRILAELENEPARDCSDAEPHFLARVAEKVPLSKRHIDQFFLWRRLVTRKWQGIRWVTEFLRRYPPTKEVRAWSSMTDNVVILFRNARRLHDSLRSGPAAFGDPLSALRTAVASTGLVLFREATGFMSCDQVRRHLGPVVAQLGEVPLRQEARVSARIYGS